MTVANTTSNRKPQRERQVVVQLNTRVSLESRNLIDDVATSQGLSIRTVIEQALENTWGSTRKVV